VLTQACDPNTQDPYPQQSDGSVLPAAQLYPTSSAVAGTPAQLGSCSVDLGPAKLVTGPDGQAINLGSGYPSNVHEGQFFQADGNIHPVTVVNARETQQSFSVTGVLESDFVMTNGGANPPKISATALGWAPNIIDKSLPFTVPGLGTYTDDAALDPNGPVLPASGLADPVTLANEGLSVSRTLVYSPTGSGLGEVHVGAALHMLIPIQTAHGTYTAMLQITAI